ncbi:hypothetical protein [Natrinema sp. SYSU A 869]|uniref:hypothetical protein n=1 Tax=Natrinema sp. SYSU A 869 TaxID=2871694 RepID=UPI001CA4607D|nr:hypothetical protein [Natrinema sp. SYSU A 869]
MIEDATSDGSEEQSDLQWVECSSSRQRMGELTDGPSRRILTDGGQAEMEEKDEDAEADSSEDDAEETPEDEEDSAPADEEAETDTEESDADESADESEQQEGEPELESEEEEAEGEAESAEDEAEEDEYHVEGADEVYEGDEASGVLHLDLDGLFLDLLGLEVNLDPVTLDVSARPGGNNLLGNLLSAVTGLLDGPGAMIGKAKSLLSKPIKFVKNLLNKPVEKLTGLFGGGEEDVEDEEASESEDESPGLLSSAVQRLKNGVSGVASWVRKKLAALVPSFPTEELVSAVVSAILKQLLEQLEPDQDEETGGQAEPSQAEASS